MNRTKFEIIDPIHGFIQPNQTEMEIIDDPIFQRLRRISQLSGAHLVYPGARHARFEHSLGTMYIAGMAGSSLQMRGFIPDSKIELIRLAGLIHDIGHGPFSHLFESVTSRHGGLHGADHEQIGRMILEKTSIGDSLGSNRRKVADLAFGSTNHDALSDVVSGVMGADTMDYLLRDGHFTGSKHARVDHQRLVQSLEIHNNKVALARSALYSFESMMHSRRQMFLTVYFHRTVRAAQVMILEAFELIADELGLGSLTLDEYVGLTDESIMSRIVSLRAETANIRQSQQLISEYQKRKLPKCVLDIQSKPHPNVAQLRSKIATKARVDESDILVDIVGASALPLSSKKEMRAITLISGPGHKAESVAFSKMPLIAALLTPISMLRVYSRSNTKKVAKAAALVLRR